MTGRMPVSIMGLRNALEANSLSSLVLEALSALHFRWLTLRGRVSLVPPLQIVTLVSLLLEPTMEATTVVEAIMATEATTMGVTIMEGTTMTNLLPRKNLPLKRNLLPTPVETTGTHRPL